MIALHRNPQQHTTPALPNTHRGTGESEGRIPMPSRVKWILLGIWAFVVFSFAALFYCGFLLWARCH